jgi:hydrogenase maturation protease
MSTLLLGLGNPILSDDAVGVRLATDFARRLRDVPDLVVVPECSVGGLALLDVLEGYERAIVLDSVQTNPASPGRWHRFDACALRESRHLTNVHDVNFATALTLGRRLGIHLPDDSAIHIFAVEVADAVTFSDRMTPPLEAGYSIYSQQIFNEVLSLLAAPAR